MSISITSESIESFLQDDSIENFNSNNIDSENHFEMSQLLENFKENEPIFDNEFLYPTPKNSEIAIIEDGKLIQGTAEAIITYITSPEIIDYQFLIDLFLTFRSYIDSLPLLELLLCRLTWCLKRSLSSDENIKTIGKLSLIRTFVTIRHWLLNHFQDDFINSVQLRQLFASTINEISKFPIYVGDDRDNIQSKTIMNLKKTYAILCDLYWDTKILENIKNNNKSLLNYKILPYENISSSRLSTLGLKQLQDPNIRRSSILTMIDRQSTSSFNMLISKNKEIHENTLEKLLNSRNNNNTDKHNNNNNNNSDNKASKFSSDMFILHPKASLNALESYNKKFSIPESKSLEQIYSHLLHDFRGTPLRGVISLDKVSNRNNKGDNSSLSDIENENGFTIRGQIEIFKESKVDKIQSSVPLKKIEINTIVKPKKQILKQEPQYQPQSQYVKPKVRSNKKRSFLSSMFHNSEEKENYHIQQPIRNQGKINIKQKVEKVEPKPSMIQNLENSIDTKDKVDLLGSRIIADYKSLVNMPTFKRRLSKQLLSNNRKSVLSTAIDLNSFDEMSLAESPTKNRGINNSENSQQLSNGTDNNKSFQTPSVTMNWSNSLDVSNSMQDIVDMDMNHDVSDQNNTKNSISISQNEMDNVSMIPSEISPPKSIVLKKISSYHSSVGDELTSNQVDDEIETDVIEDYEAGDPEDDAKRPSACSSINPENIKSIKSRADNKLIRSQDDFNQTIGNEISSVSMTPSASVERVIENQNITYGIENKNEAQIPRTPPLKNEDSNSSTVDPITPTQAENGFIDIIHRNSNNISISNNNSNNNLRDTYSSTTSQHEWNNNRFSVNVIGRNSVISAKSYMTYDSDFSILTSKRGREEELKYKLRKKNAISDFKLLSPNKEHKKKPILQSSLSVFDNSANSEGFNLDNLEFFRELPFHEGFNNKNSHNSHPSTDDSFISKKSIKTTVSMIPSPTPSCTMPYPGISQTAIAELAAIPDEKIRCNPIDYALSKLRGENVPNFTLEIGLNDESKQEHHPSEEESHLKHAVAIVCKSPSRLPNIYNIDNASDDSVDEVNLENKVRDLFISPNPNNGMFEENNGNSIDNNLGNETTNLKHNDSFNSSLPARNASSSSFFKPNDASRSSFFKQNNDSSMILMSGINTNKIIKDNDGEKSFFDMQSLSATPKALSNGNEWKKLSVEETMKNGSHIPFIFGFESELLVNQMTLIERDILMEIDWKELIDLKWDQPLVPFNSWLKLLLDAPKKSGLQLTTLRFNLMNNWIISEILLCKNINLRILTITRFIQLAKISKKLQNYGTLFQIMLALNSDVMKRLKTTWIRIDPGTMLMFKELKDITSSNKNFQNFRTEINNVMPSKGVIPFLALELSDLTANSDEPTIIKAKQTFETDDEMESVSSTSTDGYELINFNKFRSGGDIVKKILRFIEWTKFYNFKCDTEVLSKCLYISSLSEEEMEYCLEHMDSP